VQIKADEKREDLQVCLKSYLAMFGAEIAKAGRILSQEVRRLRAAATQRAPPAAAFWARLQEWSHMNKPQQAKKAGAAAPRPAGTGARLLQPAQGPERPTPACSGLHLLTPPPAPVCSLPPLQRPALLVNSPACRQHPAATRCP
jgi:hypothetical protein